MAPTAPLWLTVAAILIAIDLGARSAPGSPGTLGAAGTGALAGGAIALLGMTPAHQMTIAVLVGATAALIIPKIILAHRRKRARSEPPSEQARIFFNDEGAPCVQLEHGARFAELEERGHLEEGQRVQVLAQEDGVARVRALRRDPNPPPPLSRCQAMRPPRSSA